MLVGACAFYLLLSVVNFFSTWDVALVVSWIINLVIVAEGFALPFHLAVAEKTMVFWIKELELQP